MTRLPSLYISHGSPMTELQPGLTGERLAELAAVLPRPQAIVIASVHWLSHQPQVGGAAAPETTHDFGGFPAALYQLHYLAPGAPALASLRDEDVLVIGSGSITHNPHDLRAGYSDGRQAPYVKPFIEWIEQKLTAGDIDALLDYRRQAPFAERPHPTDEHLLPLFVALGAAGAHARMPRPNASMQASTWVCWRWISTVSTERTARRQEFMRRENGLRSRCDHAKARSNPGSGHASVAVARAVEPRIGPRVSTVGTGCRHVSARRQ